MSSRIRWFLCRNYNCILYQARSHSALFFRRKTATQFTAVAATTLVNRLSIQMNYARGSSWRRRVTFPAASTGRKMISEEKSLEGRFAGVPCPVCGDVYAKSGLPNHIRRHVKLASATSNTNPVNRRSPAWWEGWKEGYKVGMHDGRTQNRKRISPARKTTH